jgi:cytochrome c oxidase subunit 3
MTTTTRNPSSTRPSEAGAPNAVLEQHTLQHQFENLEQQHEVASLGMWAFLATEVMFFGALFVGLSAYRHVYPVSFEKGSEHLKWQIGAINTIVLLCSSFTMVMAVHNARLGRRQPVVGYLIATALMGVLFLVFKGFEYYTDYQEWLIPGWRFRPEEWNEIGANPNEVQLFFIFYWVMTSLHGLHVTIGIAVVLIMALLAHRGRFSAEYYSPVDVTGLYWHFVDIVWIFLLPMLYLMGRHHLYSFADLFR